MKLVDIEGNEISSSENKKARKLEEQLSDKIEDLLEPLISKLKLSGRQLPQQQLIQLTSLAHQILFNRMIFNLILKSGIENMDDLIGEDDIKELQTTINNQIKFVDPSAGGGGETPKA